MKLTIFILVVLFLFASFLGTNNYIINNPFVAFLYYILNLAVRFLPIIIVIFSIFIGSLIWKYYSKKHDTKKTIHSFIQIFEVILIGIISAFLILLVIAFIQLNIFSVILNSNPSVLGVKTDLKEIVLTLKENDNTPKIISSKNDSRESIVAIAKASTGDNFYGNILLPGFPKILVYPIKNDVPNIMLLDKTLVITNVEINDIELLSPIISNLFLQNYFTERQIKAYPKVSVMNEKEYSKFRVDDIKDKISKINTQSDSINSAITSTSASIEFIQDELEIIDISKEDLLNQRNEEFNNCLNDGEYIDGEFVRNNTKRDCEAIITDQEDLFIETELREKDLEIQLADTEKKLSEYEYLNTFFEAQQTLTDFSTSNIPAERGLFIPEDKIQVVLLSSEANSISNFFVSLVHEYLHYASYTPGKRLESTFFEEGLSEYFAREAIKDYMNTETNIGYPLTVKIIEQILNNIPEQDLADIYFTKDQVGLENTLNLVYGDNFYKNAIVQFETLQYTGDPDEAIKTANEIIKKIDGVELTKDDIYSN